MCMRLVLKPWAPRLNRAIYERIESDPSHASDPHPGPPPFRGRERLALTSPPLQATPKRSFSFAQASAKGRGHIGTRIFGGRGSATRSNAMCVSMRSQNAIAPIIKAFIAKKVTPGRCGPTGRLCARRIWHREGYSDAGAVRSKPASGGAMLARTHEEPLILPT